jgi:hypothetical protein
VSFVDVQRTSQTGVLHHLELFCPLLSVLIPSPSPIFAYFPNFPTKAQGPEVRPGICGDLISRSDQIPNRDGSRSFTHPLTREQQSPGS